MSPAPYDEDHLVEQPALIVFDVLGWWDTISATDELFSSNGTLGRETKRDVVLVAQLRAALESLSPTGNPTISS